MQLTRRTLEGVVMGTAIVAAATMCVPRAAQANTASTALIAAGAAAIVGALLTDGDNHPYYVKDNRRYYVTQDEASYYGSHHHVVRRQALVPENEYPVGRNAGYTVSRQQPRHASNQHGTGHGNAR